jgi:ABC-type nitrate/sulfonate/bicarbonate transport system permease component
MNPTGIAVLVIAAGLWELLVRAGVAELQFLPAPSEIVVAARQAAASGELVGRILHTLGVTLLGWGIASVIGLSLGLALGLSDTAYRYSMTSFEVTRAIPPITFAPAALLIFGFSLRMELMLVVFGGVWPVLVNTIGGVHSVPSELRDVGSMLRLKRMATVRKIVFPAALPSVVVGLRLALSLCLVLAIVAEIVGNPEGIGDGLIRARQALQPALMFVYVFVAGLLGVILNALFQAVVKLLPFSAGVDEARSW